MLKLSLDDSGNLRMKIGLLTITIPWREAVRLRDDLDALIAKVSKPKKQALERTLSQKELGLIQQYKSEPKF